MLISNLGSSRANGILKIPLFFQHRIIILRPTLLLIIM
ncbi:unnamed protein product [Schistosoma mattheei]|uniref:Uncharacterized protein n=1 Tax=Schistosoma mattheei TaxID=31246 RepID=A0A3P8A9U1_9TREM|nr:unnamed protein product [Schistosoma mattheei]